MCLHLIMICLKTQSLWILNSRFWMGLNKSGLVGGFRFVLFSWTVFWRLKVCLAYSGARAGSLILLSGIGCLSNTLRGLIVTFSAFLLPSWNVFLQPRRPCETRLAYLEPLMYKKGITTTNKFAMVIPFLYTGVNRALSNSVFYVHPVFAGRY